MSKSRKIKSHVFAAAVGEAERAGGFEVLHNEEYVRAIYVKLVEASKPFALYQIPGTRECFQVEIDEITLGLYVARWVLCDCDVIPFLPKAA